MNNYSIIRVGNDYVVQAEAKSILKLASRRMAVRLVAEASELLDSSGEPDISPATDIEASIGRDRSKAS